LGLIQRVFIDRNYKNPIWDRIKELILKSKKGEFSVSGENSKKT